MGHYMTKEERIIMQTLLDEKKPVSYIARKLGCCRQTVYNEIRRGQYLHDYGYYDKLRYSADKGQQIHDYNQTAKGRPLKIGSDHAFAAYIEHKIIVDRYSPAAALAAARKYPFATRICVSTLYSYIDKKVFYQLGNRHLWEKWKKRPKKTEDKEQRVVHPKLPSILLYQPGILGVLHRGTFPNQALELMYAVDLKQGVYSVARLIDHILTATVYVVVHARCRIYLDGCQHLQHIQPVIRHLPAPLVGIGIIRNDISCR